MLKPVGFLVPPSASLPLLRGCVYPALPPSPQPVLGQHDGMQQGMSSPGHLFREGSLGISSCSLGTVNWSSVLPGPYLTASETPGRLLTEKLLPFSRQSPSHKPTAPVPQRYSREVWEEHGFVSNGPSLLLPACGVAGCHTCLQRGILRWAPPKPPGFPCCGAQKLYAG